MGHIGRAIVVGLVGCLSCAGAWADLAYEVMSPVVKVDTGVQTGTGFAVKKDDKGTWIITNTHVLEDFKKVEIIIFEWNDAQTQVIGKRVVVGRAAHILGRTDLALILVGPDANIPVAKILDVKDLRILTRVMAVGCGMGEDVQIYRGVVTDQDWDSPTGMPELQNLVQVDCHILPGCSGSPLWAWIGGKWVVIGVMNSGARCTQVSFAIPIRKYLEFK